jgi:hypothetical protein
MGEGREEKDGRNGMGNEEKDINCWISKLCCG